MTKRLVALFLVLLLSIESFAAVVGDNDGSAFITKAEFDSLKNNFQAQIDQYNTSIDSKIDGAIASYLAGINLEQEQRLENCKSELSYPLTLYNKNRIVNPANFTNLGTANTWFTVGWDIYVLYERGARWANPLVTKSSGSNLTEFFNGKISSDGTALLIDKIIENYVITLTGALNVHSWFDSNVTKASSVLLLDQNQHSGLNASKNPTRPASSFPTDFSKLGRYPTLDGSRTDPNAAVTPYGAFCNDGANGITVKSTNKKYDGWTGTGGWYDQSSFIVSNYNYLYSSVEYNTRKIDKIFINESRYIDSKYDRLAPVTYDLPVKSGVPVVYLTNVDNNKRSFGNIGTYNFIYKQNGGSTDGQFRLSGMIDPGLTLEPEDQGNMSRSWSNKSLINPRRLYYKVTTPENGVGTWHNMTGGLWLTQMPKGDISKVKVIVDVDFPTGGYNTDRYICFSKFPINLTDHNDIGPATGNLKCGKDQYSMTEYKFKLANGVNTIYIDDMEENNNLFAKILWGVDDDGLTYLLKEPEVNATRLPK